MNVAELERPHNERAARLMQVARDSWMSGFTLGLAVGAGVAGIAGFIGWLFS